MVTEEERTKEEELESNITFMLNRIEAHKKDTEFMEQQIEEMKAELKNLNWMNGQDEETFDYLDVHCNYESWKFVKEKYKKDKNVGAFYISEDHDLDWDGLRVSEAKNLIKYLQHKIDYLESEEN